MGYFYYDYPIDPNDAHKLRLYRSNIDFTTPYLSSWMGDDDVLNSIFKHHVKLIPSSRMTVKMPDVRVNTVEIPGKDGALDVTKAYLPRAPYQNRTGEWSFIIAEYLGDLNTDANASWHRTVELLTNAIHNKYFYIVLDDDPEYYYYGKLMIEWLDTNNGDFNGLKIKYNLEPAKYTIDYVYYFQFHSSTTTNKGYPREWHNRVGIDDDFINTLSSSLGPIGAPVEVRRGSTNVGTVNFEYRNNNLGLLGKFSTSPNFSNSTWEVVEGCKFNSYDDGVYACDLRTPDGAYYFDMRGRRGMI